MEWTVRESNSGVGEIFRTRPALSVQWVLSLFHGGKTAET